MKLKKKINHQVDYLSGWEPWLVQFFFHSPCGPCPSFHPSCERKLSFLPFLQGFRLNSHNHQHSPTVGCTISAARTPFKVPNSQTSWDKLYICQSELDFLHRQKNMFFSTSWISTLPHPGCGLGKPPG